jgi:sugar phosphate isomerase/epimerase
MVRQVALQLYTVRDETSRDFVGTLRRVAQLGYAGVEFAGYGSLSSQQLAALLTETGLRAVGSHVRLEELQGTKLDDSIRFCLDIGCSNLVLPWLANEWRTPEGIQSLAPQLNAIGQRCQEQGLTFAYHNHNFEFARVDGGYLFDTLLQATDSALVKLELDVYWAAYSGVNPVEFLQAHADRIALVHLKDMAADHSMTEVGKGILDIENILAFSQDRGIWGIVEHDHPTLPSLESAKVSLDYFK